MTSTHFLRVDPDTFRAVTLGYQHALVLEVKSGVASSDQIVLREWRSEGEPERGTYSGAWVMRRVTYVNEGGAGTGVTAGYAVYSLNSAVENEWATVAIKRKLSLAERQGISPDRFWRHEQQIEGNRRVQQAKALSAKPELAKASKAELA